MLQNVTITPARRSLEFGIYRDGDNNLDAIQESTLAQALRTSAHDSRIEFTVEDTTGLRAPFNKAAGDKVGRLHTDEYTISDGDVGNLRSSKAADMSDEANLARFVARTLDDAEASGAKQTWIDLVDHGGGDGGGLETGDGSVMSMPDIARAISDGLAMHAAAHPADARRSIDGVVANQCLMDTMGFAEGYFHERRLFVKADVAAIVVFLFSPFPRPAPYFHSHSCEPVLGSVHVGVHHAGRRCHLHIDLA